MNVPYRRREQRRAWVSLLSRGIAAAGRGPYDAAAEGEGPHRSTALEALLHDTPLGATVTERRQRP